VEACCLVLDLSMPTMSGADLVAHLRAAHRLVPFVVLTAVAEPEERERMMQNGAIACLRKPASGPELLEAIRTASKSPSPIPTTRGGTE
jgi:FixJ family two-component response regulator